jgi:hypothetical protein
MKKTGHHRLFVSAVVLVMWTIAGQSVAEAKQSQKADVYFVPFSHLDFYWGGTREECLSRGNRIIAKAIQLAKESPQFRFCSKTMSLSPISWTY